MIKFRRVISSRFHNINSFCMNSRTTTMIILGALKQRLITTTGEITFLKKWSRAVSKFIALVFMSFNGQMLLNLSGIELLSTSFVFTSFTKREIRKFHVVVGVQRRQGNVLLNETCCFLPFSPLSLLSLLKLPIWWWSSKLTILSFVFTF